MAEKTEITPKMLETIKRYSGQISHNELAALLGISGRTWYKIRKDNEAVQAVIAQTKAKLVVSMGDLLLETIKEKRSISGMFKWMEKHAETHMSADYLEWKHEKDMKEAQDMMSQAWGPPKPDLVMRLDGSMPTPEDPDPAPEDVE